MFVVAGAVVGAALLQRDWVHDNEWLAMSGIFLLGYVGIIFESFFEFNKAAIGLLMATALWVVYAGQAGTTGNHIYLTGSHTYLTRAHTII